jgi:hypothetical protein
MLRGLHARKGHPIVVGLPYQTDRVTLAAGLCFVYISHIN